MFFIKNCQFMKKRCNFAGAKRNNKQKVLIMAIDDVTLRKGYWYILQNPKGYLSELDEIDDCLADYFAGAGIIAYGINARAELRYQVTPDGERIAKVDYTSLTLKLFREKNDKFKVASVTSELLLY